MTRFGKPGAPAARFGESWECWDENPIARGATAGATLADERARMGAALVGTLDPAAPFPVLTKLIDAAGDLSVQVHPDDREAARLDGAANGKSECWYVLEAAASSALWLGWRRPTTPAEIRERIAAGTLTELLRRVPVAPGDAFYVPAGTVHAIGGGIVLFEAQQNSDLTYRLYDYGRLGADGKPRPLHLEKALAVVDVTDDRALSIAEPSASDTSAFGAIRTLAPLLISDDRARRELLIGDPRFPLERIVLGSETLRVATARMPLVLMPLSAPLELDCGDGRQTVAAYETALVPPACETALLHAPQAPTTVLAVAPASDAAALLARLVSANADPEEAETFLAAFQRPSVEPKAPVARVSAVRADR